VGICLRGERKKKKSLAIQSSPAKALRLSSHEPS
jgi:hypothetical protein